MREPRFSRAQTAIADREYVGKDAGAKGVGFGLAIVKRPDYGEAKSLAESWTFKPLPRRWVIERTFGYLMHNRVLACRYERLDICAMAVGMRANIRMILRRWKKL